MNMDLILCATKYHKQDVLELYPELEGKVFTMKEYVKYDEPNHDKIDIADPWGYDKETYLECSKEISKCHRIITKRNKRKCLKKLFQKDSFFYKKVSCSLVKNNVKLL